MGPVYEDAAATSSMPTIHIPINDTQPLHSCFSQDGDWLAVTTTTGITQIYRARDGRFAFSLKKNGSQRWPCTSACFRPTINSTLNVVLSGDVGGHANHWHATSGKHLSTITEPGNEIYTVAYQPAGQGFATAGLDAKIRVYDEVRREISHILSEGDGTNAVGHTNRIFSVKWHPYHAHIVLSGGWDGTLQFWDLRLGKAVRRIFGPNLCGDALDINANTNRILTGSWRTSNQLQEWDFETGKLIDNFMWPQSSNSGKPCQLYSARYGTGVSGKLIAAGGSGSNEACLFHVETKQYLRAFRSIDNAVVSAPFSRNGDLLAIIVTNAIIIIDMHELLQYR